MKIQFSDIRLAFQWVGDLCGQGEMIITPTYTVDALTFDSDYTNADLWDLASILNDTLNLMGNNVVRVVVDNGSLVSLMR